MAGGPTILVKKADGTQVRMTMEEFKLYKSNKTLPSTPLPAEEKKENVKIADLEIKPEIKQEEKINKPEINKAPDNDLPMNIQNEALSTTAPVKEVFVNEAKAVAEPVIKKPFVVAAPVVLPPVVSKPVVPVKPEPIKKAWKNDDYKSLLEDAEAEKSAPAVSAPLNKNELLLEKIIKELPFKVAADLQGRLRSLILSRIKEVREDEQVITYATRTKENGGLGLTALAANDLLTIINKNLPSKSKLANRGEEQQTVEIKVPEETTQMAPAKVYFPEHQVKKPEIVGKPVVQDIVSPVVQMQTPKQTVGPIEEFKFMSLVDFRRLGAKPDIAIEILQQKLQGLKMESYLLYSQAVAAWLLSPLYEKYRNTLKTGLNQNQKISNLLLTKNKEDLSLDEFKSLLKFNQSLNV